MGQRARGRCRLPRRGTGLVNLHQNSGGGGRPDNSLGPDTQGCIQSPQPVGPPCVALPGSGSTDEHMPGGSERDVQVLGGSVCADQALALGALRGFIELSGHHGGKGRKWRAARCRVTRGHGLRRGLRAGHGLRGSQEGCPPPTDGAGSRTRGWLPVGCPAGLCRNPWSRSEAQGGTCVTDHHQLRGFKQHRLLPRSSESGERAWGRQQP